MKVKMTMEYFVVFVARLNQRIWQATVFWVDCDLSGTWVHNCIVRLIKQNSDKEIQVQAMFELILLYFLAFFFFLHYFLAFPYLFFFLNTFDDKKMKYIAYQMTVLAALLKLKFCMMHT